MRKGLRGIDGWIRYRSEEGTRDDKKEFVSDV